MSGGSFNYLYAKSAGDLLEDGGLGDAIDMGDALARLGYAADAAQETHTLVAEVRASHARIEALRSRLEPVWHAMEWWQSSDWGEDRFKAKLADYRGEPLEARDVVELVVALDRIVDHVDLCLGGGRHGALERIREIAREGLRGASNAKAQTHQPEEGR